MPPRVVVPASLFGAVLGLAGLGNGWRVAALIWDLPRVIGEAILAAAFLVWALLSILYAAKWIWHRESARAEIEDPIQCCFVGLVPVSTLLIALALLPYSRLSALVLFIAGAGATLAFSVWRHGALWRGGRDPAATTPVLYLPSVAGSFVVAIVAGALDLQAWGQLFFGAGLLAWLALESVILHRLLIVAPLAVPLRPTLGIQLAPPAVGLVAYLNVTEGDPGLPAAVLLGYALLQALILLRLLPWIREQAFSAGYWAFTFGAAALALGAERMVERGVTGPAEALAPILFIAANLVVGGVAVQSAVKLFRGELIPTRQLTPP